MAVERFPIEAGHIMMFARAIGDPNPMYPEPHHVVAPPTFVQASVQYDDDYSLRPKPGMPWFGSGRQPSGTAAGDSGGGSGTGLHAEQHYEYHREIRPGDVLSAETREGDHWEKQGRRAGKLVFTSVITDYRNQDGELVVTARSVGVRTERPVEQ